MTNTNTPPAWHPDPTGRHQFRYWDGSSWTAHVADDGTSRLDPLTPVPATSGRREAHSPEAIPTRRELRREEKAAARARKDEEQQAQRERASQEQAARELAKREAKHARIEAERNEREAREAKAKRQREAREADARRIRERATRRLTSPGYRLIGSEGYPGTEIEGEFARLDEIYAVLGRRPAVNQEIVAEGLTARLIPEPENPHDRNAVMVIINQQHVGYLSRDDAARYHHILAGVFDAGSAPLTGARIWASARKNWETGGITYFANVRVALGEPHMLVPVNDPPHSEYSILPWGSGLQVTGEEDHQDVLSEYTTQEGDGVAIGSIHIIQGGSARAPRELIEIRINGARIGQLTAATSQHFIPTVRHLEAQGMLAAVWLRLKGSLISTQVVIQSTKAHDLPAEWFAQPQTVPRLRSTASLVSGDAARDDAEIRTHMRSPMWGDELI